MIHTQAETTKVICHKKTNKKTNCDAIRWCGWAGAYGGGSGGGR